MESGIIALKNYSWSDVDWNALRRLRERFLQFDETPGGGDYWKSERELASYDFTFAERIGWKWDAVLAELRTRGWTPPEGTVLDWGCGTGVAGRRVITEWRTSSQKLLVTDRSRSAEHFAIRRARESFPGLPVERADANAAPPALLVISHVLNELPPGSDALERLLTLASQAQAVLWVEPGTAAVSRRLIAARARLMPHLRPVAPCPHPLECGLLSAGNERHWCHHFAKAPREVFQDAGWGRFAKLLEIDLGSVPFSFLVLDRRPLSVSTASRVIGEPRHYKGYAKILTCREEGVQELTLQKRDDPEGLKAIKKDPGSLYEWNVEGDKIRGGERVF
jgi:hypothetical protein